MKSREKRIAFCTAILSALLCSAVWAAPGELEIKLADGIKYHDAARKDRANLAKAKEILESIKDDSPLALGYYGSVITLEADAAISEKKVIKALALLNEGNAIIDEAVKKAPDLSDLHFLRMENSYEVSMSSPINRFKIMKADIEWLSQREKSFDANWQGTLELYRGLYFVKAKKMEEALAAFDACIAISPGSPEAGEAKKQLDRYEE